MRIFSLFACSVNENELGYLTFLNSAHLFRTCAFKEWNNKSTGNYKYHYAMK